MGKQEVICSNCGKKFVWDYDKYLFYECPECGYSEEEDLNYEEIQ